MIQGLFLLFPIHPSSQVPFPFSILSFHNFKALLLRSIFVSVMASYVRLREFILVVSYFCPVYQTNTVYEYFIYRLVQRSSS